MIYIIIKRTNHGSYKRCRNFATIILTKFHLMKNCVMLFRPKTIVASFVHLMVFNCKVVIDLAFRVYFLVLSLLQKYFDFVFKKYSQRIKYVLYHPMINHLVALVLIYFHMKKDIDTVFRFET